MDSSQLAHLRDQELQNGSEQAFAPDAGVMHELKEAQVERFLYDFRLRITTVFLANYRKGETIIFLVSVLTTHNFMWKISYLLIVIFAITHFRTNPYSHLVRRGR